MKKIKHIRNKNIKKQKYVDIAKKHIYNQRSIIILQLKCLFKLTDIFYI
jgi:hypothetical protein